MQDSDRRPTPADSSAGIPLALVLLGAVVALVGVLSGAVIFENYRRGLDAAMDVGRQQFDSLRTEIALQQQQLLQPLEFALGIFARDPMLAEGRAAELAPAFFTVLEANPQITEVRVAYDDGGVFAVANLGGSEGRLRQAIAAPDEARFAMRQVVMRSDDREVTWTYIGADHEVLGEFTTTLPGAAISRELWADAAHAAPGQVIETKAAVIPSLHTAGVTFAAAFAGAHPGAIATDASLGQLSAILAALKSGDDDVIFAFDGDGTLLASPDVDPVMDHDGVLVLGPLAVLTSPVARGMIAKFKSGGLFSLAALDVGRARYLSSIIRIGVDDPERPATYLALALPEVTFTGPFIDLSRDSMLISVAILLAAIPLAVFIARRLARPLVQLQRITDGIARLDMSQPVDVPTRIREIGRLAASIGQMKNALGEMAKFVPKSLVTDLLRSGTQLAVEGERRELTLMFSDVRGFTPLVEAAAPDDLMAQMSQYFDALAGAVITHRGTVDKYIGDAIFAFWNAPLRNLDHPLHACEAVLAARAASLALNRTWADAGQPQWHTCFSLHLGDVVVGNVGARDRLNYTAIGAAVNMAARLEGLNKVYGTAILVSAAVMERTADRMRFRPVDLVLPKGASLPLMIYELLGQRAALSPAEETQAVAWEKFYASYTARDWRKAYAAIVDFTDLYPDDPLGERFRDRVTKFLANAPAATWDGATRFDVK